MTIIDKTDLLADNPIDRSYGATIQDFDRDGEFEIFVATQGGPNHLYKRIGGRFLDVTPPELADPECSAIGVAAADMNDDGFPDLYVLNTSAFMGPFSEPDRLFVSRGPLVFEDLMEDHPDRNIAAGRSVCWTDPLGDGRFGLYLCNYGAPNKLFVNRGERDFRNQAPVGHGLGLIVGGRAVVSQDILDSGRMDIFCVNEGAPNTYFENLGEGRYREVALELGLADPANHGRGLQAADLDRDGRVELLWLNWEDEHRYMVRTSERFFVDRAAKAFARASRARILVVADLDNDGWEEVFVNNIDEPNRLFRWRNGELVEVDPGPLLLPDGAGTGATCGDLDGDGMLELYVCHGESMPQRNRVAACEPNGNHFLRVMPLTPAGAPAIGARVTVESDPPMIRFIDGGSGYLCQMEPVAHFGLGKGESVPPVRVRWSDGAEARYPDLPLDRLSCLPHPGARPRR